MPHTNVDRQCAAKIENNEIAHAFIFKRVQCGHDREESATAKDKIALILRVMAYGYGYQIKNRAGACKALNTPLSKKENEIN